MCATPGANIVGNQCVAEQSYCGDGNVDSDEHCDCIQEGTNI